MAVIQWGAPASIATILTTELNSLANGASSGASAEIDNETGLYQFIALELALASLTPTTGAYVTVFISQEIDGTNFGDINIAIAEVLATFPLSTSASTKRSIRANIAIPPFSFKLNVENRAGVAFAASGNTLKYRRYNAETV